MSKTYSTLFPQVITEIEKRVGKTIITTDSRFTVKPSGEGGSVDSRALAKIITDIANDNEVILGSSIISGLDITATTPPSTTVNVSLGVCTSNGVKWEITADTTLIIPLDSATYVFYVTVSDNALEINRSHDNTKCEIGRIIVPMPGTTTAIEDDKPADGYNGWIISAKDVVYDEDQEFDDASIEKLRDIIGAVLADNLIGNIRLSENLKIINTQGTLELDSNSVNIKDANNLLLARFDRNGTFFYDADGVAIAKFGNTEAYIGNILITPNSIETRNFVSGAAGFQIKDNGDVEFNNGTFRGALSSNTGIIGGWTLTATEMYATTTGIIKTSEHAGEAGYNGVVLDSDGLRIYNNLLGLIANLPSNGNPVTFVGGSITGITDLAVADGGTGRSAALVMGIATANSDQTAGAEGDLDSMTVTLTTVGTKLFCTFTGNVTFGAESSHGHIYLQVDTTTKNTASFGTESGTTSIGPTGIGGASAVVNWLETGLTPGSHTVNIRWQGGGGYGIHCFERTLIVLDLD